MIFCKAGERKHRIAEEYLATHEVEHRGVPGAGGQGAGAGVEGEAVGGGPDRQHREETRIRQPLFVSHHRPEWGHVTIKMSGHPPFGAQIILNGHEYVARQAEAAGIAFTQGRQLLHRGRRPGGPGSDRRCLVAACGCRAAEPGLPALDLHRVPVLRA